MPGIESPRVKEILSALCEEIKTRNNLTEEQTRLLPASIGIVSHCIVDIAQEKSIPPDIFEAAMNLFLDYSKNYKNKDPEKSAQYLKSWLENFDKTITEIENV